MSSVWTPKEKPVVLDKFSHLSLDAQKVMASMYRDFHIKKVEIKAATSGTQWNQIERFKMARMSKPEYHDMKTYRSPNVPHTTSDPLPHYQPSVSETNTSYDRDHRALYEKKQNLGRIPIVETVSINDEYSKVQESEPDNGEYNGNEMDSPPVETRDYEILSQFHLVDTQADLFSDSPLRDGDTATKLMTEKRQLDDDLIHTLDKVVNNIESQSEDSGTNKPSTSFSIGCSSRNSNFNLTDPHYHSGLKLLEMNEESSACSNVKEKQRSVGLLNSGYSNSIKYSERGMTYDSGTRKEKYHKEMSHLRNCDVTDIMSKHLNTDGNAHTDRISSDRINKRKEFLDGDDLCEESPFLNKAHGGPKQLYSTPVVKGSTSDSEHQKKPKLKQTRIMFERIGSGGQGSGNKFGNKHSIDDDNFDMQAEKKKAKLSNDNQKIVDDSEKIIYIDTLSTDGINRACSKILESEELVLSLVYTNGATQFRDNLFNGDNKKKNAGKVKNEMKVEYIALGVTVPQKIPVYMFNKTDQRDEKQLREFWLTLLRNDGIRKIGFQIKDIFQALFSTYNYNYDKVDLSWTVMDAGIGAWLLDPDKPMSDFEHLLSALHLPQQTPNKSSINALQDDMVLLSEAMKKLFRMLQSKDMWNLFVCLETKLVNVLAGMERRKMSLSIHTLLHFSSVLKKNLASLEEQAHKAAGHAFLLSSHHQLRQILFEELKLDSYLAGKSKLAKTSVTKEISTSEAVLTQLLPFHPLPEILLEYRQLQKLKSTYIDGILSCVDGSYLTTHWDQTSAATGRLSSHHPNIQAIPKLPVTIKDHQTNFIVGKKNSDIDKEGVVQFNARDVFISRPGWSFLSADFQQIELRLLGHLANDPVLQKIFSDTTVPDIFNALAAQWKGKAVEDVNEADREQTKRVVYSVMYGIGKEKLAGYLKCTPDTAKAIMTSFLLKFPAVNQFTKSCVEFCQKYGYTSTVFKRRRLFPNITHRNGALRSQAERQCVNFCVQGSAADICKAAMLQVENALTASQDIKARLLVQIHDEILLEVEDSDIEIVTGIVRSVMESEKLCGKIVSLRVPIPVSISVGKTWGQMQSVSVISKDGQ